MQRDAKRTVFQESSAIARGSGLHVSPQGGLEHRVVITKTASWATHVGPVAAHGLRDRECIEELLLHRDQRCLHSNRVPTSGTRQYSCLCQSNGGGAKWMTCLSTSCRLRHAISRRDAQTHVDMVRQGVPFDQTNAKPGT